MEEPRQPWKDEPWALSLRENKKASPRILCSIMLMYPSSPSPLGPLASPPLYTLYILVPECSTFLVSPLASVPSPFPPGFPAGPYLLTPPMYRPSTLRSLVSGVSSAPYLPHI